MHLLIATSDHDPMITESTIRLLMVQNTWREKETPCNGTEAYSRIVWVVCAASNDVSGYIRGGTQAGEVITKIGTYEFAPVKV